MDVAAEQTIPSGNPLQQPFDNIQYTPYIPHITSFKSIVSYNILIVSLTNYKLPQSYSGEISSFQKVDLADAAAVFNACDWGKPIVVKNGK